MRSGTQILIEEHDRILSLLSLLKRVGKNADTNPGEYLKLSRWALSFLKTYGDIIHHKKEEDWLFPEMCKKNSLLAEGIIQELSQQHEEFREQIKTLEENIEKGDAVSARNNFDHYAEMLQGHIAAENDELFPMAETLMSETELDRLHGYFQDADRSTGIELKKDFESKIEQYNAEYH